MENQRRASILNEDSMDRDIDALLISIENSLGNINRTIRESIIPTALSINKGSMRFNTSFQFLIAFMRSVFLNLFPDGLVHEFDNRFKTGNTAQK